MIASSLILSPAPNNLVREEISLLVSLVFSAK
nr:MAG TPA: hypothetical protein [Caudoviricetes sp.]